MDAVIGARPRRPSRRAEYVERQAARKARGGFYTRRSVTDYLAEWAIQGSTKRILEPSVGDGSFLEAIARRIPDCDVAPEVVAVELIETEAKAAGERAHHLDLAVDIQTANFFALDQSDLGLFDAIVGNPPWIRYHGFNGEHRVLALQRAAALGVSISSLASSWAPYLVHAISLLAPSGRLGFVLPGELLQADYAQAVRRFLASRFKSIDLIAFETQMFSDADVDAVLLLASHDDTAGLRFRRAIDVADIPQVTPIELTSIDRWRSGLAPSDSLALLRQLEDDGRFVSLGSLASVDIGVVTGNNDFFLLSDDERGRFNVGDSAVLPVISRSDQLSSGAVTQSDFDRWRSDGRKVWLLSLSGGARRPDRYLFEGTRLGVPDRYKCRTRKPWYSAARFSKSNGHLMSPNERC